MTKVEYDKLRKGQFAVKQQTQQTQQTQQDQQNKQQPQNLYVVDPAQQQQAAPDVSMIATQLSQVTQSMEGIGQVLQQLSANQVTMAEQLQNGGRPLEPIKWASKEDADLMATATPQQLSAVRRAMSATTQVQDLGGQQEQPGQMFIAADTVTDQHQQPTKQLSNSQLYQMGDTIEGNLRKEL
jgi:hypothetical protein